MTSLQLTLYSVEKGSLFYKIRSTKAFSSFLNENVPCPVSVQLPTSLWISLILDILKCPTIGKWLDE